MPKAATRAQATLAEDSLCASPQAKVRGKPGVNPQLVVDFHQGRKHLPIVTLKRAA